MGFFSRHKIWGFWGLLLFLIILFILSLGPAMTIDPSQRKLFASELLNSPAQVVSGAEETSRLAKGLSNKPQKFAFSYIHSFSAAPPELSPLVEDIADYFSAPSFFLRLSGHGLDDNGESFSKAKSFDWLNDSDRAIEKGRVPGRDLILIGMSFGGLLATFATLEHQTDIKALILISPFFELTNPAAKFISGPLGGWIARMIVGAYHEYVPRNELHQKYTTHHYSTAVLPQLMDCVNLMRAENLARIKIPLLILYTEQDKDVSVSAIKSRFKDFGSQKKYLVEVPGATNHILTGNMIEPQTLPFVEKQIEVFLENL